MVVLITKVVNHCAVNVIFTALESGQSLERFPVGMDQSCVQHACQFRRVESVEDTTSKGLRKLHVANRT